MLKINHLYASYGEEEVLHDVNLTIKPNQVTIIVGPNGSGKSTLLKSIIRSNMRINGTIQYHEEDLNQLQVNDLAKRVAYLPQGKHVPDISVGRMVLHGRFAYLNYPRRYRKIDYEKAYQAMCRVGIEHLMDKEISQLSGGNQQKVYIAMALAQDTPVILLDEPTTYLDIAYQIKLLELVTSLATQGKTVVVVLHDLAQALRYGHHIVVMNHGEVVGQGSPEEIYQQRVIDTTFDIHLQRIEVEGKWQYFVE